MDDRSKWMVGWKRVQFGVKIYIWGVDPDACGVRIRNVNIRMDLCDRHSQRGTSVYHGVFAK
jgi:hypothetical protein